MMTKGRWKKRIVNDGGLNLAVFEDYLKGREAVYTRETLEFALETVKKNRSSYVTQEAYDAMIDHFNEGLEFCNENRI